jgi:multidrug efflux pump subunit AcrA (membrane-fusion protein)
VLQEEELLQEELLQKEVKKQRFVKPKYLIVGSTAFLLSLFALRTLIGNATSGFGSRPEAADVVKDVSIVGIVKPSKIVRVSAEADASKINAFLVDEGEVVKRGQVLARLASRISPDQIKQQQQDVENKYNLYLDKVQELRQAELTLANLTSEKPLSPLRSIQSEGGVQEARNRINSLTNILRQLEPRIQRYQTLVSEGALNSQALDDLQITYFRTQQELESANIALEVAIARKQEEQVATQRTQTSVNQQKSIVNVTTLEVQTAKSNWLNSQQRLNQLQRAVSNRSLYSPVSGVVVEKVAMLGDVVSASQPLLAIADQSKFELTMVVQRHQVACVLNTQNPTITSPGNGGLKLRGLNVREGEIDLKSGKPTVIVDLPVHPQLRPEMTLELSTRCPQAG